MPVHRILPRMPRYCFSLLFLEVQNRWQSAREMRTCLLKMDYEGRMTDSISFLPVDLCKVILNYVYIYFRVWLVSSSVEYMYVQCISAILSTRIWSNAFEKYSL